MKEYRLLSTNPRSYTGKYDLPSNMPVQDQGLRPRSYTVAYWMVGRIFQYWTSGLCSIILKLPGWFPSQDIQRKAYVLGMILPIFIRREKTMIFNFLSAEERGESLHKLFNEFERQYCSIPYRPLRYLSMKKAYYNRINL